MVNYVKAKALFSHVKTDFRRVYEATEEAGRKKCFESSNSKLEAWKEDCKIRHASV